ncbi:glycosyl transferase group 1 [Thermobaculum terrenum ATCC BAA-798]|uniref:Glycosyl transferase group 1 n=1 Tax=Thermobaculum terrenum (strain ATCC BAA-798 / CCMEE 7001 / YNP1) TaxID=525904 RepID=D1CIV9_THET1|nr:glycosyltransferase [Thermobaculum terrenum]ACZ43679.1 glycosyl transferase group 1 [Thermobaculum terrenum ATCC BAA-798]
MRVLVVTNMYPTEDMPSFGTFVHDQVESLRELGVDVDVLYFNGRKSTWNYLWAFPRFWYRLLRRRYDLIHAHYVLAGVVARAQWGYKVVLTHHGPEVLGQPPWQAPLCRIMTPLFDEVIHVTEEVRSTLGDADGWVIPCGVDLKVFHPMPRSEARERAGLPQGVPLVLWAGDYWRPEKRFDLVERSMEHVKTYLPEAELVLLTGKPHDLVPIYMNACDALVLTSDLEGSPMVVKEAMACNLPVVSVRVGDVPEVVSGTEGCYLVERDPQLIADALVKVLVSPRRTNGREHIGHLSREHVALQVLQVYRHALGVRETVERYPVHER